MTELFISIGSNINQEENCRSALTALEKRFGPLTVSGLYESEAVGFKGEPFYNSVVALNSDEALHHIKKSLTEIENAHGRIRGKEKFSARTLDLDILLYGDLICPEKNIPRDEIERYAFVLEPLAEVAPSHLHPTLKKTYRDMWAQYDKTALKQRRISFSR